MYTLKKQLQLISPKVIKSICSLLSNLTVKKYLIVFVSNYLMNYEKIPADKTILGALNKLMFNHKV